MNKNIISVILVDDHPIVMEGLSSLLLRNSHIIISGRFTTGKETLDFLSENNADVVLLDISLPDIDGTELCLKIKAQNPRISVLALSNHNDRSIITQMLQNGASGYLLKNSSSRELFDSIQNAINGKLVLNDEVKEIIARGTSACKKLPRLTKREKEVLKLVADGLTTPSIAEKLFISPLTVETHRRNLMQKFGVNNSASLTKSAIENKII